jgi:hypothetical protein
MPIINQNITAASVPAPAAGNTTFFVDADVPYLKDSSGNLIPMMTTVSGTPPVTSTDPGAPGQLAYDANYFYVCIATNSWIRAYFNPF